jgi:hypothetical protein
VSNASGAGGPATPNPRPTSNAETTDYNPV